MLVAAGAGGSVTPTTVNVYLHDRGRHLSRSGNARRLSLYHYDDGHHISLTRTCDDSWSGYDYGVSGHLQLTIRGRSVSLDDCATSSWH